MSAFFTVLRAISAIPAGPLAEPWDWRGSEGSGLAGRDGLYKALEDEQYALVGAAAPSTEAGRIVGLGQRAWGDLRGLLAMLSDADLDADPGDGEWRLREVLGHVLLVERRYLAQTEYALRRGDQEPVSMGLQMELQPADLEGGVAEWVQRLARARSDCARLSPTPDEALTRPTRWVNFEVDVRFRLHRFAAHLVEHTIQADKTAVRLGFVPTEAQRIAREISRTRGAHELGTPAADLARLDAGLRQRAGELVSSH